jgi:hypothetical protein
MQFTSIWFEIFANIFVDYMGLLVDFWHRLYAFTILFLSITPWAMVLFIYIFSYYVRPYIYNFIFYSI